MPMHFMEVCGKMPKLNTTYISNKFLKGGYQLVFEFLNKLILPGPKKKIVASTTNQFMMENLWQI